MRYWINDILGLANNKGSLAKDLKSVLSIVTNQQ